MNFGIIGFGKIARKFTSSITFTTTGKVVAIGSKSLKESDPYLQSNPNVKVYQDYDALLDDKNIDAIYIALPHQMHKEWIIKALRKQIPVLCEKPAVLTTADMAEVKAVALENKTYFLEALKTKFNAGMLQLKKDVHQIGKIETIHASFCFDALSTKDSGSYLFSPKQGGALNDVGTYTIGFVLDLISSPIGSITSHIEIVEDIERYFNATLHFENGISATIEGAIDRNKERFACLKGAHGSIQIPMFNRISEYTIHKTDGTSSKRKFPIVGDDMTYEIQTLINDVNENKVYSDIHSLDDSYEIIRVAQWIREANISN